MYLLQIAQAPVIVRVGDVELEVPKFTLKDMIALGARISGENVERIVEGMDDVRRREYLTLYPPIPPGLGTMREIARSLDGAENIISACLPRSKAFRLKAVQQTARRKAKTWTKERPQFEEATYTDYVRDGQLSHAEFKSALPKILESILTANGSGSLVYLGYELADVENTSAVQPPEFKPVSDGSGEDESEGTDPLTAEGQKSSEA